MSELDGFILIRPAAKSYPISLSIVTEHMYVTVSRGAFTALDYPKFCNVFIDANHKRVMVKAAQEGWQNTFRLAQNKNKKSARINNKDLSETLGSLFEQTVIPGHVAGEGIVIFQEE